MIGLRAPQQKFQGSRAPGTPPLGPCVVVGQNSLLLERVSHAWTRGTSEALSQDLFARANPCLKRASRDSLVIV